MAVETAVARAGASNRPITRVEENKMKRALSIALGAVATVAVIFGVAQAQQKTISIGTGGTGGVYYPMGGGLANVLSKSIPGLQATAEVTGGSVDNLK